MNHFGQLLHECWASKLCCPFLHEPLAEPAPQTGFHVLVPRAGLELLSPPASVPPVPGLLHVPSHMHMYCLMCLPVGLSPRLNDCSFYHCLSPCLSPWVSVCLSQPQCVFPLGVFLYRFWIHFPLFARTVISSVLSNTFCLSSFSSEITFPDPVPPYSSRARKFMPGLS